jgi:hypothetical protein
MIGVRRSGALEGVACRHPALAAALQHHLEEAAREVPGLRRDRARHLRLPTAALRMGQAIAVPAGTARLTDVNASPLNERKCAAASAPSKRDGDLAVALAVEDVDRHIGAVSAEHDVKGAGADAQPPDLHLIQEIRQAWLAKADLLGRVP